MSARIISTGPGLRKRLSEIARGLDKAAKVRIGFLENATYPDGKPVAMIAAIQEFGAPARNIPPRPFFRQMIAAKSPEWPQAIADLAVSTDYDAAAMLGQTGEAIAGQLRESIINLTEPPLAPATVARKGSDKPLISTGNMLNSVDYEVE